MSRTDWPGLAQLCLLFAVLLAAIAASLAHAGQLLFVANAGGDSISIFDAGPNVAIGDPLPVVEVAVAIVANHERTFA